MRKILSSVITACAMLAFWQATRLRSPGVAAVSARAPTMKAARDERDPLSPSY
jgi:hypothetical protein